MRFFDREKEREKLLFLKQQSEQDCSRMTVLIGRRRIGKTMLIRHTFTEEELIYLFVARKSETDLVSSYTSLVREKGYYIPDGMTRFAQLLQYLFELGKNQILTIAIDEFQEFENINPSVFSDMQNLWDTYKEQTKVNLVISGSAYRLMQKIFMDKDEPLFNRADAIIRLQPFSLDVQKEILAYYNPKYTPDDLLTLYVITGGVPKYIAWLMDANCKTKDEMYAEFFSENSHFRFQNKSPIKASGFRGRRWIRTTEGINQQIYSLPHLATLVFSQNSLRTFEPMEGIEPTTPRLQITCSGQLSYIGIIVFPFRRLFP